MRYDYIEIGTSDFDTLLQSSQEADRGLSVEPLSRYLDRLPDRPGKIKVNCAISDHDGQIDIFFVPDDVIEQLGLEDYLRGCNSVGTYHSLALEKVTERGLNPDEVFASESVPVKRFATLAKEHNVEGVDYLKVDTEGHDTVVLRSYFEYCKSAPKALAHTIRFESNYLIHLQSVNDLITEARQLGYYVFERGEDTVLRRTSYVYYFWKRWPYIVLDGSKHLARSLMPDHVHAWMRRLYLWLVGR